MDGAGSLLASTCYRHGNRWVLASSGALRPVDDRSAATHPVAGAPAQPCLPDRYRRLPSPPGHRAAPDRHLRTVGCRQPDHGRPLQRRWVLVIPDLADRLGPALVPAHRPQPRQPRKGPRGPESWPTDGRASGPMRSGRNGKNSTTSPAGSTTRKTASMTRWPYVATSAALPLPPPTSSGTSTTPPRSIDACHGSPACSHASDI